MPVVVFTNNMDVVPWATFRMQQQYVRSYMGAQGACWNDARGRLAWETVEFFSKFAVLAYLRPIARAWLSSSQDRRDQPELGWALLLEVFYKQRHWPGGIIPCERCCYPTGSWCESCDDANRAVCHSCENDGCDCHGCTLTLEHDYRPQQVASCSAAVSRILALNDP